MPDSPGNDGGREETELPADDSSDAEAPVEDAPAEAVPVEESADAEASAEAPPADEPPADEPPADEPPADEPEVEASPAISAEEVRASVEALLYASGEPLPLRAMKKAMRDAKDLVAPALKDLCARYAEDGRGLQIVEVAGGWQITTRPEYHERVRRLFDNPRPPRLSIQALETLAVIAYRQPITVPEIVALRGVRSAGVVRTLLERKLVRMLGRKKVVGLPLLYGTTKEFLLRFGLKSLKDLPQLKDMSEVFGDEVAEQLEVLDALEPPATDAEIVPLESDETGEPAESADPADPEQTGESTESADPEESGESADAKPAPE